MASQISISGGGSAFPLTFDGSDALTSGLTGKSGNNLFSMDSGDITDSPQKSWASTNNQNQANDPAQQMASMLQMIMLAVMLYNFLSNLMNKQSGQDNGGGSGSGSGGGAGAGNYNQDQYDIGGGNGNGYQPQSKAYVPQTSDSQNTNNNNSQNGSNGSNNANSSNGTNGTNSTNGTNGTNTGNSTNSTTSTNPTSDSKLVTNGATTADSTSDAGKTISTGTGTGHTFNVTNNTDRPQYFAFSSGSSNTSGFSNNTNAVMKLNPGESAAFEAGDNVPGIRISSSGANGETNANQNLFEDTIEDNPMNPGQIVHNPDVSSVVGNMSYDGKKQNITFDDGTNSAGDSPSATYAAYHLWNDDATKTGTANPMTMALDPAKVYNISFSDG